jgi:hypothetical protein
MGDEMKLANMTPRGRLVAEVFDCRGEGFPSEYLEASGHLDPGVAVRLHDTCAALYDGRWSVEQAYGAWDEWESVLKGFAEGYGLDSLYELMAIADPLSPEDRALATSLAPLDREALSQARDWLKAYVVYYGGRRPGRGLLRRHGRLRPVLCGQGPRDEWREQARERRRTFRSKGAGPGDPSVHRLPAEQVPSR